ncbi:MAG: hypothetical protein HKN80_11590, partial [Acidimicrobiia bacterium]|nr:hypothetical protein [Acidimicrobiia bacterium]
MTPRPTQAARPTFILSLITLLVATMLALVSTPALAADELGSGDTPSGFDPATGLWTVGGAEPFYFGVPEDTPFLGDWNGDGVSTPGLYRPSDGVAYVRDSLDTGNADRQWSMGNPGDIPLVGDWDGDGVDSFGVYRSSEGKVYLRNAQTTGFADVEYYFGNPADVPFAGDFNGDGIDTVGVYRTSTGQVFIGNEQVTSFADTDFFFGNPGDVFIAGDWDGNGTDTVGVVRPSDNTLYFRNSNTQGFADGQVDFDAGDVPLTNQPVRPNIVATASGAGVFSTLLAAATQAGLAETLSSDGPFTVFAPTDAAFAALPDGVLDGLLADTAALTDVLLYHVLAGRQSAESLLAAGAVETLQGQQLIVSEAGVNGVNISGPDVLAANGVIHIIDEVLIPPSMDIIETAAAAGTFGTLLTALDAASLTAALEGEGPLTVLAPTDAAFAALPAGTLDALLADIPTLTDTLLYHVIDGAVPASVVSSLTSATTLEGQDILITQGEGVLINGDTLVSATDLLTSNGIIHVIDAVLIPPSMDIIETATDAGVFDTLLAAVDAAGLTSTLQGEGPFTVLAPTDDAFDALGAETISALLADIPLLTDILLYHVIDGAVPSSIVSTLSSATTLNGDDIYIADGSIYINGVALVVTADIQATNGIIHVLDTVLIPPAGSIVDIAVGNEDLETLVAAVTVADLVETLSGPGPFTVFAPTDAAFDALPAGTLDALLADIPALTDILLYHVVSGAVTSPTVVGLDSATTLNGDVTITVGEGVFVNDAEVVITDIIA